MLAKKYKLPVKEFLANKSKVVFKSDVLSVKSAQNKFQYSRFGSIISKKTAAKATKRNRIKRTVFDFIRAKKAHLVPGKDVLITVFPKAAGMDKNQFQKELALSVEKIFGAK